MKEADLTMLKQSRRGLIFVVDDEIAIAESAAKILRISGFDARAFSDPLAALEASQVEAPNLLLSDVIMPGLNGFELSSGLVKGCPQCRVLLFSGDPSAQETLARTPTEKSCGFLVKPIRPEDLLKAIQSKLDA
jgi:DNA-binding NtrC family response regulator